MIQNDRSWPINCWYVCAVSSELDAGVLIARTICDFPLAIYRGQDGQAVALLDRCPHRHYPLSNGALTGEGLQCGYHGLVFASDGKCYEIPSQKKIPGNACVRSFPTAEAHGLIWVWTGELGLEGSNSLPSFELGSGYLAGLDFSCNSPSDTWGVAGPHHIYIRANYQLVIDNLLDLTHTAFVHAATFDNAGVLESERTIKAVGSNQLIDFFNFKNTMSGALRYGYMLDENVPMYSNFLESYWCAPGAMILVHGAVPEALDRETHGAIVLNTNIITPETAGTCHYFWAQSVYRNRGDGEVRNRWEEMTKSAFAEDEVVLTRQQANLERFQSLAELADGALTLEADKGIVLARRMVRRIIRNEAASDAARNSENR